MHDLKTLAPPFCLTLAAAPAGLAADAPGLGEPITEPDIKGWSITILPDGTNCRRQRNRGSRRDESSRRNARAVTARAPRAAHRGHSVGAPSLTEAGIEADKTIGNFWADPTTLFDYIRRAHALAQPRTLSNEKCMHCAPTSSPSNKFIGENDIMDAQALPKVKLPQPGNFIIKFPTRFDPEFIH